MARLRDRPAELLACITQSAARRSLNPAFIEKDYWLTELLRSLARPLEGVGGEPTLVLFKGGTSLSKSFGLIERFSEDVDILVGTSGLGKEALHKRVLKPLCDRAREELGCPADVLASETGVHRIVVYRYRSLVPVSLAITAGVRLELGTRGGPEPHVRRAISSYLAEDARALGDGTPDDDMLAVEIEVLAPERTLVEKLSALHTAALASDPHELGRRARHLYDVARLLESPEVRNGLARLEGGVAALTRDIEERSRRAGWKVEPRPAGGFAASPAFGPGTSSRQVLEEAYARVLDIVWGAKPSAEDCIAVIASHRNML